MAHSNYVDQSALRTLYPAHLDTLKQRHDRALERSGAGHAVIFSGAARGVFLDDYNYPFKANPHFVSWAPLTDTPLCYLVYTPDKMPVLVYYQDKDYWHVPPSAPAGYWPDEFDIRVVHELGDVAEHLPVDRDNCVLIGEIHDPEHSFGIDRINPGIALNMLHFARATKTDYELECMRAASRRGVAGHRAAEATFREGKSEFDIHLS